MNLEDFKRYCLRALGEPVVTVDVTDEQIQDRYEEALRMFQDHHYDGVERSYLKHIITAQDMINRYVPVDPNVTGIIRALPFSSTGFGAGLFSAQYQFLQNDVNLLWNGGNISYYEQTMQQINMIDQLLNGRPQIRFNRVQDRVYLDVDWAKKAKEGDVVVFECYVGLDPVEFNKIFDTPWFKKYVIALLKKQWATNIKKFSGVKMIGGTFLDGDKLYAEASQEIAMLEEELDNKWSEPPDAFYMG